MAQASTHERAPAQDRVAAHESIVDAQTHSAHMAGDLAVGLEPMGESRESRPPLAPPRAAQRSASRRIKLSLDRLKAHGMVASDSDRSRIAEEFRFVKRPLLLKAFAKGPNAIPNGHMILVTSASPGEGKTFCAVSLAMSIALERDLTVLLIDADVARPKVHELLGFENDRGLVDLVADQHVEIADVMVRTDLENLSIIPAGRQHHLSPELLASERMGRLVQDIAQRYSDRVVIFDSPPVLASSIPGILALYVGQVLFVVEAQRTSQHAIDSALSLISECKNINLVLNKSRALSGREEYGAYYGTG